MEEIWKDIEGYEGLYQVSNFGRVKRILFINNITSKPTNKILSNRLTSNGYSRVGLCKNGKVKDYKIHQLVAKAFLTNPNKLPCVNHKDGNKQNNIVTNLEWCTYSYNSRHAFKTGLINNEKHRKAVQKNIKIAQSFAFKHFGEKNSQAKLTKKDVLEIKHLYANKEMTSKQLSEKYAVHISTVQRILSGKSWSNLK